MAAVEGGSDSIQDHDDVSRFWFDSPAILIDPSSRFPFCYERGEQVESVFWRKHIKSLAELHDRGCKSQKNKNERETTLQKPISTYVGVRTANVACIRNIKDEYGHFEVYQSVENGDPAHANIKLCNADGTNKKLKSNYVRALVHKLLECFVRHESHVCEE